MSSSIGRTLLGIAGLYATAMAGSFLFLRWYRPSLVSDGGVMPVALVALPLAASVGYLLGSRGYVQEERLILGSIERPVLEDGRRVVAIGPIEPLGALVRSPFARKDCVAYQYEIDHESRDAEGSVTRIRDYWGMAVAPWQVRTPAGPVRILGYARLEAFPEELDDDAYGAAEAYVRSTLFRHPTSPGERLGSLAEPLSTESDSFRDDICADPTHVGAWPEVPGELRKLRLLERRLDVGQTVCAVGYYSAAKKALVPTTRGSKQLRISTSSPEAWAADSRGWANTSVRWGSAWRSLPWAAPWPRGGADPG